LRDSPTKLGISEESAVVAKPSDVAGTGTESSVPPATFTEEEVQRRISAATSTLQKQADLSTKQALAASANAEELQRSNDRLSSRVEVFQKAEAFGDDAREFADWKASEETRIAEATRGLGRRAMDVTRSELSLQYGVPKEILLGATTDSESTGWPWITPSLSRQHPRK
jgi:hypothetical protein